jgi:hypothetical protein
MIMAKHNLKYPTIVALRKKLVKLNIADLKTITFQEVSDIYNEVSLKFIDLDVPKEYKDKIVESLNSAAEYFNLIEEEEFIDLENDTKSRNEITAILSKVSTELNKVLVELQKEIGIQ